ncbi:MAG: acyl carrier protein [Methylocystis sp.]|uniref:acyl carrier protein n=1 Tax=Phenylobacterium sp. TaxID=1871053 RepID=UPI0025D12C26|nr:acyl carrier protein [Phenylobacterium sp.]MCA3585174.1 acyl carrier protein [Methylocystis sp.]MCA6288060.1 acyl carrier protein [Phenylobacterium sp.]MCA6346659.1 acyl carrier protein [Phenylobacterium sp.]MCA6349255.1 acyl carrier protein [Phenylobacterium sp.]MCA6352217.1 acyl carrier protein [Phenylobacterium sp.]
MPSTYDLIADFLIEICNVHPNDITPDVNIIDDLGVDSLAFMDVTYEIDRAFKIKLPVEDWIIDIDKKQARIEDYFVMSRLVAKVEELATQAANSP